MGVGGDGLAASLASSDGVVSGFVFNLVGCVQVWIAGEEVSNPDPA